MQGSWESTPHKLNTSSDEIEFEYSSGFTSSFTKEKQKTWAKTVSGDFSANFSFEKDGASGGIGGGVSVSDTTELTQSIETAFSVTSDEKTRVKVKIPSTACPDPSTCRSPQNCTNCRSPPWTKEFFGGGLEGLTVTLWEFNYAMPRPASGCPAMRGHGPETFLTPSSDWMPCCLPGKNLDNRFDGMCQKMPQEAGKTGRDESPNACCEPTKEADWAEHLSYCDTWKTNKNVFWNANGKPKATRCAVDGACHIEGQFCPPTAVGAG